MKKIDMEEFAERAWIIGGLLLAVLLVLLLFPLYILVAWDEWRKKKVEKLQATASGFVTLVTQGWGQSRQTVILAAQAVIDQARFKATVVWDKQPQLRNPFDRLPPIVCAGRDGIEATKWLRQIVDTMEKGNFEEEQRHVAAAILAKRNA